MAVSSLRNAGLLLGLCLASSSVLRADLFWKVAAEAPSAPTVTTILGDDHRTIAFGPEGTWEFDGAGWTRARLLDEGKETVPGNPVFAGGRFFAVTSDYGRIPLRVSVLEGSTWRPFVEVERPGVTWAFGPDRLYVTTAPFGACRTGSCDPDSRRWGDIVSYSLADGSARIEPAPPACSGELFVVKGRLFLIATPPGICLDLGVGSRMLSQRVDESTPFYRLDPSGWTSLPPVPLPGQVLWANAPLPFTPSSIWATWLASETESAARVFDGERWSEPIVLPRRAGFPVEWSGEVLYVSAGNYEQIRTLTDGKLVPSSLASPFRRAFRLYSAGSRLFAWSVGNVVTVLSGGVWNETAGIDGKPGASVFVSDGRSNFALMGGNVFRRSDEGWTRLPPPGGSAATQGFVYRGRIGVTDLSSWPVLRLLFYSGDSGRWEDLGLPSTARFDDPEPQILESGGDLLVAGRVDEVFRLCDGLWSRIEGMREGERPGLKRLRVAAGQVFLVGEAVANRVDEDRLVPAFTDLPEGLSVVDVAEARGVTYVAVRTPGLPSVRDGALVLESARGSWKTVAKAGDLGDAWRPYLSTLRLEPVAGRLFLGWNGRGHWMGISNGRLAAVRSELPVRTLSSEGGFGTSHDNVETYAAGMLLEPVERVRKTIPAIVDAEGIGGAYRSTLFLGNFSAARTATVRLYAGPDTSPCREIELRPGTQVRVDDPLPGFVGPLTVDFDGLVDDDDGWAAVRVWNETGGGTAGVALEGRDAGSFVLEETPLLLPYPRSGTRTHLAAALGADGERRKAFALAHLPRWYEPSPIGLTLESGGFTQVDPDPRFAGGPITCRSSGAGDDLLPYSVRNDGRTQDGVVIQAGPRWVTPGRGTVFVPAAISVTNPRAEFRTELAVATAGFSSGAPVTVRYRSFAGGENLDATTRLAIPADGVLRVDDLSEWLSTNGIPAGPDGFDGTLTIEPEGDATSTRLVSYAAVLARPPSASGDYSTSVPVFPEAEWAANEAVVPGLLENEAFRSNLCVANPEPPGGPQLTLAAAVRDDAGRVVGALPSITLRPGERRQLNQVIRLAGGAGSGWVSLKRVGGAGRFVAYGVVNDNSTSDGTVFRMVRGR